MADAPPDPKATIARRWLDVIRLAQRTEAADQGRPFPRLDHE